MQVLCAVERGWRAAREISLALAGQGVGVTHLIKGRLPAGVRSIIAPQPGARLVDLPRWRFWPALWAAVILARASGRLRWVLVDNDRTQARLQGWCRCLGVRVGRVRELEQGYEVRSNGEMVSLAALARR
jgi:hypothetical protein